MLAFSFSFSFSIVFYFFVLVLVFVNEFVIFSFFAIFVFVFVNENHTGTTAREANGRLWNSNRADYVERPFKVTQGHPLLCLLALHSNLTIMIGCARAIVLVAQ